MSLQSVWAMFGLHWSLLQELVLLPCLAPGSTLACPSQMRDHVCVLLFFSPHVTGLTHNPQRAQIIWWLAWKHLCVPQQRSWRLESTASFDLTSLNKFSSVFTLCRILAQIALPSGWINLLLAASLIFHTPWFLRLYKEATPSLPWQTRENKYPTALTSKNTVGGKKWSIFSYRPEMITSSVYVNSQLRGDLTLFPLL